MVPSGIGVVLFILAFTASHADDVNKNLPLYCEYVKDDVTYMQCTNAGILIYDVLKELAALPEEERLHVTSFKIRSVDMPALRTRAFAMFPNLKKLELSSCKTYSCANDSLQGLPHLEELIFKPGISTVYHFDGLFNNLNLTRVNFGTTLFTLYDLSPALKSLTQYKLESFATSYCRFPWEGLTEWFQGQYLKTLSLTSLNFYQDTYEHPILSDKYFKEFTNLETLTLTSNKISRISNGAFKFCAKLQKLYLGRNWLRQITSGMLEGLDALVYLDLSSNMITSMAMDQFHYFHNAGPLLKINLNRNPMECGCRLMSYALDYMNNTGQISFMNFKCNSPPTLKGKNILDMSTIENPNSTQCEEPKFKQSCCNPLNNQTVADWDQENKVEIKCTAAGVPTPQITCTPVSGNPLPKDSDYYYELQSLNSYTARWYHAKKSEAGVVRCTAKNDAGSQVQDCAVVVADSWVSAGHRMVPALSQVTFLCLVAVSYFMR